MDGIKDIDMEENEKSEEKDSKQELLKEILANIQIDIDADVDNRKLMLDDLKFCTLDQWPEELRNARENDINGARPCLTIDKINQYITQVVNDMRQNKPAIKMRPADDESDVETAKIHQGLVRHIEYKSSATIAYETAGEWAVKTGRGYFRIVTEYLDGTFDQEPRIKPIQDAFSVWMGPHVMPDGSDAERATIISQVTEEEFKRKYPKAKWQTSEFESLGDSQSTWRDENTISVAEHFYTEYEDVELLFLKDGTVVDKDKYDGSEENIKDRRTESRKKIKWVKLTGAEILQEQDWAGKYIPVIEVIGKSSFVEGKQVLWGLVRPAKDNLRMYNYWASAITEKIGLSPKAPFVGAKGQFEGLEEQWKSANRENRAYLEYNPIDVNGNAIPRPERVQPSQMESAMVQMMAMIENDVRGSLGMYKASVGDSASQQSGKALLTLQRESDTGTFHFSDNLAYSICHAGRILLDINPKIYDTKRIIRILGDDDKPKIVKIDPKQPEASRTINTSSGIQNIYNLGVGDYDVSVTVGPSYNTKRMEAAQVFSELGRSATDPASAAVLNYLAIKNADITSSDEAVTMLKALLPPQVQSVEDGQAPIPPQVMQKIQQMQMQEQQMQEVLQKLQQENQQLKAGSMEAQMKIQASSQESSMKLQAKQQESAAELQLKAVMQEEELKLERERVMAMIALERDKAIASLELKKMEIASNSDNSIDTAIEQVKGIVQQFQGKVDNSESAGMESHHSEMMNQIAPIIESLNRKKTISLQMSDGRVHTATIQ